MSREKVILREEVSPEVGYTKEEIESGLWNSPPTEKGQGRYLILNRVISPKDFREIQAYYWSEEDFEEFDIFGATPGWRITVEGIRILKEKGYEVEIDTLQQQREREKKRKEAREKALKERKEQEERSRAEYTALITEFETFLGNPQWRAAQGETIEPRQYAHRIQLQSIEIYHNEYTEYYLMPDGRVFVHRHYNSDWWDNLITVEPVSQEAQKFFQDKQQELDLQRKRESEEIERREREQREIIKNGLLKMLERTTWEELEREMKKRRAKTFCPRELLREDGKPLCELTIKEAKKIIEE